MPELPRAVEIGLLVFGIAMFVGTLLAIPWLIRRLPPDHFVRRPKKHSFGVKLARNVAGGLLIALGLAMLVLPGQGVITVLIGLSLLDLEIKHRALRWLLTRKKIGEGVQRIRSKAGKPPLVIPAHA